MKPTCKRYYFGFPLITAVVIATFSVFTYNVNTHLPFAPALAAYIAAILSTYICEYTNRLKFKQIVLLIGSVLTVALSAAIGIPLAVSAFGGEPWSIFGYICCLILLCALIFIVSGFLFTHSPREKSKNK